jgi:hypothetical protein
MLIIFSTFITGSIFILFQFINYFFTTSEWLPVTFVICLFILVTICCYLFLKDYQTNQGKVLTSDAALKFFGMEKETNYLSEEQKRIILLN